MPTYKPQLFSRHRTHDALRRQLPSLPYRVRIRLGSVTTRESDSQYVIINPPEGVHNAMDKRKMKECFRNAEISCAEDLICNPNETPVFIDYPVVAKNRWGSRGEGVYLLKTEGDFEQWKRGRNLNHYIFEKFHNYTREYRLHVSDNGCFYALRKMLKLNSNPNTKWKRNNQNSVWIYEHNPLFDKPVNWDAITTDCVKALKACKMNIGAFDVKVQAAKKANGTMRRNPNFILIELNSAPSMGANTTPVYLQEIPRLVQTLYNQRNNG